MKIVICPIHQSVVGGPGHVTAWSAPNLGLETWFVCITPIVMLIKMHIETPLNKYLYFYQFNIENSKI